MKEADNEFKSTSLSIKRELTGRLVYSLDVVPVIYEIKEYRTSTNEIILRRMFDTNNILMDDRPHTGNLKSTNEDNFFSRFQLYSPEEELGVRNGILHSKDHVINIKYQTMDVGHEKECLPVEIYP